MRPFISSQATAELTIAATHPKVLNLASSIIPFSLILRNSVYRGTASYENLLNRLSLLDSVRTDELRYEFASLARTAFERKLVAHPAYENNPLDGIIVKIYTSFGCINARYEYGSEINYTTVMLNLFGKVPSNKVFRVCTDSGMTLELTPRQVTYDMEIYVVEVK